MRHAHCDRCNAEIGDMDAEVHLVAVATMDAVKDEIAKHPSTSGCEFFVFKRAELCASCAKDIIEVARGGGAADVNAWRDVQEVRR